MPTPAHEFLAQHSWAANKNWEGICTRSIVIYTIALVILLVVPAAAIDHNSTTGLIFRLCVYAFALGSIGYLFAQSLPIFFRPPGRETAAIADQRRSYMPKISLYLVVALKIATYVLLFGIARSWWPWQWDSRAYNPLAWFTWEQVLVIFIGWWTVQFDVVILQWVAFRFARLTDEISSDRVS